MHAVYLVIPPKLGLYGDKDDEEHSECMLTFIAQMDPKGWIWKSFGYQQEVLTARTYLSITNCSLLHSHRLLLY
jgi:hypothetical protein